MLSEQCERSNCNLFANDILPPTGEGVWGAEYRSPKVGAPAPGAGKQPARGGICMGERSAPVRGGPFCRNPTKAKSAAGLSYSTRLADATGVADWEN